jgi:hypothetical protein
MTTITIDDEMMNELVAVSHFKNAQEAVIKILADYLQQYKKEPTLFDQLRLVEFERENTPSLKRGSAKKMITFIADDFCEPLEDFKDYM